MESKKISELEQYNGSANGFMVPGVADGETQKADLGAMVDQAAGAAGYLKPSGLKTINGESIDGSGDLDVAVMNPFKGTFLDTDTFPAEGADGEFIYVVNTSVTPRTANVYAWNGSAFADTGKSVENFGLSFASGQAVPDTGIKDLEGNNDPNAAGVLSAEAGKELNVGLHDLKKDIGVEAIPVSPDVLVNCYVDDGTGQMKQYPGTSGYVHTDRILVKQGDKIRMCFTLNKKGAGEYSGIHYAFYSALPVVGSTGMGSGYVGMPLVAKGDYQDVQFVFEVSEDGYLAVSYQYRTGSSSSVSNVKYDKVYYYDRDTVPVQSNFYWNWYLSSGGVVTSYGNPNVMGIERVAVSAGDTIRMKFDLNKKGSSALTTLRYAYFSSLPQVGDTGTGFDYIHGLPTAAGLYAGLEHTFVAPMDGYLAVSCQYSEGSSSNIANVSFAKVGVVTDSGARLKMVSLGDSITFGYIPHGLHGNPDGQLDSYAKLAAMRINASFVNYGVSGNWLMGQNADTAMCNRFAAMDDDADIVTFMGGTNDLRSGIPLGTMTDRVVDGDSETYTYYAGCHKLVEGLYRKYVLGSVKSVKLIGITMPKMAAAPSDTENGLCELYQSQEAWVSAFIEVCRYYGVTVCDFYHDGIAAQLAGGFQNTAYGNTGYFCPLIPDGVHPNQLGQKYLSVCLLKTIKSML